MERKVAMGIGVLFGIAGMIATDLVLPRPIGKMVVYDRGDKPAVMRVYVPLLRDTICVQQGDEYIPLKKYLDKQQLKGPDRTIEEIEIKKVAHWYDD